MDKLETGGVCDAKNNQHNFCAPSTMISMQLEAEPATVVTVKKQRPLSAATMLLIVSESRPLENEYWEFELRVESPVMSMLLALEGVGENELEQIQ